MFAAILRSSHVFIGSKHQAAGDQGRPGEGCGAPGAREARWFVTQSAHTETNHCVYHLFILLYVPALLLLCPSSDEALRLLRRTQRQSGLILAETHPLQGELEDATARAYATMGENNNA